MSACLDDCLSYVITSMTLHGFRVFSRAIAYTLVTQSTLLFYFIGAGFLPRNGENA